MNKIYVTPREGLKIPNPETGELVPEKGDWFDDTSFWRRREKDGDVTITKTAPKSDKKRSS